MLRLSHAGYALLAISGREIARSWYQRGRFFSSLVRPALWLLVFAAGFQNVFGVSIVPPYETYIEYQVYIVPGLLAMVLLFNGMQSSLSMVYDREMGMMRLLLTAPLPRGYILFCKLLAGTWLSLFHAYAFLLLSRLFQVDVPLYGWLLVFPALLLSGLFLGSLGLLLSVHVRQLENFAGMMNFIIFPLFFLSPALYPLWKLEQSGAWLVYQLATINPFSHVVALIRHALYGQFLLDSFIIVALSFGICLTLAIWGYDPQRGSYGKRPF